MNRVATCPYGIHEALHMAHVALCIFDDHVAQHPAVANRPELSTIADRGCQRSCLTGCGDGS